MKGDRLSKIFLFGHQPRAKQKAGHPRMGPEEAVSKDLKENGTSWGEGVKRLNRLEWRRRSMYSCIGLRQFSAAVSCYYE